jgi:hypothetical protein
MTKNQVMLYKLLVNFEDHGQDNLAMAMSVQRSLMTYGYMLDESAFSQLKKTDAGDIKEFFNDCESVIKEYMGGTHSYESLYKNFPNDVMSMEESELWLNQILHYWGVKSFPEVGKIKDKAFDSLEYKVIRGTDESGLLDVYIKLAESGQSLTPMDTKVLKYFANLGSDLPTVNVPFKENLAVLAEVLPNFKVSTVVDVLRIAVAMSGGDPSLPPLPKKLKRDGRRSKEVLEEREKHKFKLSKEQISRVMDLFEGSNLSTSDLNQGSRYGRFIKLAEILRVQDFKSTHPKTFEAFNHLRNQKRKGKPDGLPKIRTWNSQVESQFKLGFEEGIRKLAERPGEFLRRLDYLVRSNVNKPSNLDKLLKLLSTIGDSSSNKVLYEVYSHFEGRLNEVTNRSVFIKGARSKTPLPNLPALPRDVVESILDTVISCIKSKLGTLSPLGKVYIDEELKKVPLPTNMRSLSESLTPIIRGQRLPMVDEEGKSKNYLRPFIHWYDEHGNEDLDLHGYLIGESSIVSFGFNGIHKSNFGLYSGDVRNRRGACAEYVDLNIEAAREEGYKYYVSVVNNFQGRPLSTMKDCVTGFMFRDKPEANTTWKPDTIGSAMKLNSPSKITLVGCYDLETLEYIHLDLDWTDFSVHVNTRSGSVVRSMIESYVCEPKLSVYDLLRWHVESRGNISSKDEADTHLMFTDFSKDYTNILPWMGV